MGKTDQIKAWIQNLQDGKPTHPDAILLGKDKENRLTVTLLDRACCQGKVCLDVDWETLRAEDLEPYKPAFNHRH